MKYILFLLLLVSCLQAGAQSSCKNRYYLIEYYSPSKGEKNIDVRADESRKLISMVNSMNEIKQQLLCEANDSVFLSFTEENSGKIVQNQYHFKLRRKNLMSFSNKGNSLQAKEQVLYQDESTIIVANKINNAITAYVKDPRKLDAKFFTDNFYISRVAATFFKEQGLIPKYED